MRLTAPSFGIDTAFAAMSGTPPTNGSVLASHRRWA
ncbi:hypothetical protein SAMN05216360_10619 [Methylobacterium phyllostachyos]|uniref:Uncharacterized protein n=1 Tax=Methylobacterium phyllostachyos TaxID=582672 RepID=A0A1G9YXY0_9HYPH|nr:hypothetical protein SAMN05216360_10619 [Methylobacterium phyllostachyos]